MNDSKLDDFELRIKQSLETSAHQLDAATQDRLYQIRRNALKAPQATRAWHWPWLSKHWLPASGLALCSLLLVTALVPQLKSIQDETTLAHEQTAMLELMETPEDADTLSDPAFYLWLDETEGMPAHAEQQEV